MMQVTIKRRKGQKNIRIRITREKEVILSAPYNARQRDIEKAIRSREKWIERHIAKLDEDLQRFDPLRQVFYRGNSLTVSAIPGNTVRGRVSQKNGLLQVTYNSEAVNPELEILSIIKKWFLKKAKQELTEEVIKTAKIQSISVNRVYVRNQKTRWGSSSSGGNISLNWRIIMLPPEIQHYLIIHELCHQKHMNHSAAYWKEVERRFPDVHKAESWLKTHRNIIGILR